MNERMYKSVPLQSSEITPEHVYLNRRNFLKLTGVAAGAAVLAACGVGPDQKASAGAASSTAPSGTVITDELGSPATSYDAITHYNNYYEFTMSKSDVAPMSKKFNPVPWSLEIGGLVHRPNTFGLEDLLKKFTLEERVYRMRCVEGWSMVIPWLGFPLVQLLNEVEPMSDARYVRFETVMRPEAMPGQKSPVYPWPYQEGLRLDEALNDLTILATGLYGKEMPNQNGAPIRLVVPWKYGFKSAKSIVKIELVAQLPKTFWASVNGYEYGFYSNVNPKRPHPRWSQANERRIGEIERRETLMFNGYSDEVAHLYHDMDLNEYY